jgi:RNA polymerase sigma-70 factor (sigma-E family)
MGTADVVPAATAVGAAGGAVSRREAGRYQQVFAQAVADHHRHLARFAYRLCGDSAQAEDAVAEAYARVWPRWSRGRVDDLLPYLRRAVLNEVYGRGRRRQVERRHAGRATERQRSGQFEAYVGERDALAVALDRLPRQQRVVVVLRIVEDLSEEDTAAMLGVPAGTVKSRLHRALGALRTMLEGDDA